MATYTPGYIPNSVQTNQVISLSLAVDYNVSPSDTGKFFSLRSTTTPRIINLPRLQAGLRYRFTIGGAIAGTINITSPDAGTAYGVLLNTTVTAVNTVIKGGATSTAQFTVNAAIGDYMDVLCDGERWYYSGISAQVAGFAP